MQEDFNFVGGGMSKSLDMTSSKSRRSGNIVPMMNNVSQQDIFNGNFQTQLHKIKPLPNFGKSRFNSNSNGDFLRQGDRNRSLAVNIINNHTKINEYENQFKNDVFGYDDNLRTSLIKKQRISQNFKNNMKNK